MDETGQDAGSNIFIVVAVVAWDDVERVRSELTALEYRLTVGSKKWHKLRPASRLAFMDAFLAENYNAIKIYFGKFKKPILYYVPTLEVVQHALMSFAPPIEAVVSIDGLDSLSAKKMTNALRTKHLHLKLVKGWRDKSEVLIRLADRWAGCLRQAIAEHDKDSQALMLRAKKKGLLTEI